MFATIVFFVVLVLVLGFKITMTVLDHKAVSDASLRRAATFSGITLADATITRNGISQSLAGDLPAARKSIYDLLADVHADKPNRRVERLLVVSEIV